LINLVNQFSFELNSALPTTTGADLGHFQLGIAISYQNGFLPSNQFDRPCTNNANQGLISGFIPLFMIAARQSLQKNLLFLIAFFSSANSQSRVKKHTLEQLDCS